MKKNIFRILLCILLLLLVVVIKSDVQAMTFTYSDVEHNLPDLPEVSENFDGANYSIYYFNSTYVLLTYVNYEEGSSFVYTDNSNGSGTFGIVGNENSEGRIKIWYIDETGSSWYMNSWQPSSSSFGYYRGEFHSSNFIRSSVNIYGVLSSGDVDTSTILFPQSTLLLPPIMEKQKGAMRTTLQEIMNILPMILVVVVSYLGLRKALIMLQEVLRKA